MGQACERVCANGNQIPMDIDFCTCDPCFSGLACDIECSNFGSCGCKPGYKGLDCLELDCPNDCSGFGTCVYDNATQNSMCVCNDGFGGADCSQLVCPGDPMCSDRGTCVLLPNVAQPSCQCFFPTILGEACQRCNDQYTGENCTVPLDGGIVVPGRRSLPEGALLAAPQKLSSGHGYANLSRRNLSPVTVSASLANKMCICVTGKKGPYCEDLDCPGEPDCSNRGRCVQRAGVSQCICNPGFTGPDCSQLVCPGTPACSNRGQCILPLGGNLPQCVCNNSFAGAACERCASNYVGADCSVCEPGKIGWANAGCSVDCVNGFPTEPNGAVCQCYADLTNGFWTGTACDQCQEGWAYPTCTTCHGDYGSDGCSIRCAQDQGVIVDASSVTSSDSGVQIVTAPLMPVVPTLDCVSPIPAVPGAFVAWLGYNNLNTLTVTIPIGPTNQFMSTPAAVSRAPFIPGPAVTTATFVQSDLGQPTKFVAGRVSKLFNVTFTAASSISWSLTNTLSNQALSFVDIVSNFPVACTGNERSYDPTAVSVGSGGSGSNGQQVCKCLKGFWGSTCDFVCPRSLSGGPPCSDHGTCSPATGLCTCQARWSGDDVRGSGGSTGGGLVPSRRSIHMHNTSDGSMSFAEIHRRGAGDYSNQNIPRQPSNTFVPKVTHCSVCSPGYIGQDCSVATVDLPFSLTQVVMGAYGHGHFMTFDGAMFDYRGVATLQLFQSANRQLEIVARQVSCEESRAVCITALYIRIDTITVIMHAPYQTGGSMFIWRNDKLLPMGPQGQLDPTVITTGFVLERVSLLEYALTSATMSLSVRIFHRQFSLTLEVPKSFCTGSTGMLGGCNGLPDDDLRLGPLPGDAFLTRNVLSSTPANLTMTQMNIHNTFAPVWTVPLSADPFGVVYNFGGFYEQQVATGAGFALLFNSTGATTNPLYTFAAGDVTLEFLVKAFSHGGVLLSFATSLTFAVIDTPACNVPTLPCPAGNVYSSLKLQFGAAVYDMGVSLQLNQWNQISLVWKASTDGMSGLLQFYLFDSAGMSSSKTILLSPPPFLPGGTLSVGQWAFGTVSEGNPPAGAAFVGLLDEIRLWNRWFDQNALSANYMTNLPSTTPFLSSMWKLNEGEGDFAADLVSPIPCDSSVASAPCLYLPSSALYLVPQWVFSDAPLPLLVTSLTGVYSTNWVDPVLQSAANTQCRSLFISARSPLLGLCADLGSAESQFLSESCLYDISVGRQLGSSLPIATFYGDQCQDILDVSIWPAQLVCQAFPPVEVFPSWIGVACDRPCVFGQQPRNAPLGTCACVPGYWGADCSQGCPGGVVTPCNNHGVCRPLSGTCLCDPDWQGNAECSACTPGWTGADCSIAITKLPDVFLPVWSVFGEGHFTSLSGKNFDFSGVGVYELSISPDKMFKVATRQVTCQSTSASCAQAVSVYIRGHYITIEAPLIVSNSPTLLVDGVPTSAFQPVQVPAGSGYFLSQPDSRKFVVSGPDSLQLTVTVTGRFMDLVGQVSRDYCAASTGVMGTCDPTDDASRTDVAEYQGLYATCTEYGQAHLLTFDNASFTFPGSCTYLLAEMSAANNSISARVYVTHAPCLTGVCVSEVTVVLPGVSAIRLLQDGAVFVGATSVTSYPFKLINAHKVTRTARQVTVHVFASLALISYSDEGLVVVSAAQELFINSTNGLCGNYDGFAANDLPVGLTPYDYGLTLASQLPNSVACTDSPVAPPTPACVNMTVAMAFCAPLLSAQYAACFSEINQTSYYQSCIHDACAAQDDGVGLELACLSYSVYETACQHAGVQGIVSVIDNCGVCFGDGSSCSKAQGHCFVFGSAMFNTFDGKVANFPGACDYTLAKDCAQNDFDVQIRLGDCGNGKCIAAVGIRTFGDHFIELRSTGEVAVDRVIATVGTTALILYDGSIISKTLDGFVVSLPAIQVVVAWNLDGVLDVQVPSWYQTRTCGLCGTFDGSASNDFFVNTPVDTDLTWLYGRSWKVGAYTFILSNYNMSCTDPNTAPPACNTALVSQPTSSSCLPLRDPFSPYATCFATVAPEPMYEACLSSVCQHAFDGLAPRSAASAMLVYEALCDENDGRTGSLVDVCGVVNGDGSSCAAQFNSCIMYDVGRIWTFNQTLYTFRGTCDYLVANGADFVVSVQRASDASIASVTLTVQPDSATLYANGMVLVNGERVFANSFVAGGLVVRLVQSRWQLYSRVNGVVVQGGSGTFTVSLLDALVATTAGLCSSAVQPLRWSLSLGCSNSSLPTPPTPPNFDQCLAAEDTLSACRALNPALVNPCFDQVNVSSSWTACLEARCRNQDSCAVIQAYEASCLQVLPNAPSQVDECGVCYGNGLSCLPQRQYFKCHASGDPHYTSFDGTRFDFQGACDYTMAQLLAAPLVPAANLTSVPLSAFEVQARHGNCPGPFVQCIFGVAVRINSHVFEFGMSSEATFLNGQALTVFPVTFEEGVLEVLSATQRRITLNHGDMIVNWRPYSLDVYVGDNYAGLVAGVCGFASNTLGIISRTGARATNLTNAGLFGTLNSWANSNASTLFRSGRSGNCSVAMPPPPPPCPASRLAVVQPRCNMLSDPAGRYAVCQTLIRDTAFEASSCVLDACEDSNPLNSVCQSIQQFESRCLQAGGNGFQSVVDECGVCFGDGSSCAVTRRTCTVSNYINVLTFNGNLYRTNGTACTTTLFSANYSLSRFVTIELRQLPIDTILAVKTPFDEVLLLASQVAAIVNGNVLTASPFVTAAGIRVVSTSTTLIVQLGADLTLRWVPETSVITLAVDTSLAQAGQVTGMCGLYLASAAVEMSAVNARFGSFAAMALAAARGDNSDCEVLLPMCLGSLNPTDDHRQCDAISDPTGPAAACFGTINPLPFASLCRSDACSVRAHTACSAYEMYSAACLQQNITLPSPLDRCGVCLGDGSACAEDYSECLAYGGNHVANFTGALFDVNTDCDTVLAQDCQPFGTYSIIAKKTHTGGGVQATLNAYTVTVFANASVITSSASLAPPIAVQMSASTLILDGSPLFKVTLTRSTGAVMVSLLKTTALAACGVCGGFTLSSVTTGTPSATVYLAMSPPATRRVPWSSHQRVTPHCRRL
jgi:hypothetical protein